VCVSEKKLHVPLRPAAANRLKACAVVARGAAHDAARTVTTDHHRHRLCRRWCTTVPTAMQPVMTSIVSMALLSLGTPGESS
jgi:hypothetical protein